MPQPWSDEAIRHLLDSSTCPRCGLDALHDRRCVNCGADLRGDIADKLWTASMAAVAALHQRQEVLDSVPFARVKATVAAPAVIAPAGSTVSAPATPEAVSPAAVTERSSATVQSVLAVAGAGLFAVAAIVFTFFNADLTDHVLRSVIVGIVTVIFLGGAWLLARRGLQFSAEAVGALGMVFVALDVYALSELAPPGVSPWVYTAIGTLVSAVIMIAVGALARIRSWLFLALLGLAIVPAMVGYAGSDTGSGLWPVILGHLAVGFAVLALLEAVRKLAPRFDGALTADRVALTVLQVAAVVTVVVQLRFAESPTPTAYWISVAGVLAGLAILATFATRHLIAPFWSFLAGGFAVSAISVLPFALDLAQPEPYYALVPGAAAVSLVVLAAVPTLRTVVTPVLTAGVLVMAAVASITTVAFGAMLVLFQMVSVWQTYYGVEVPFGVVGGISIVIGVAAAAAGLAIYAAIGKRRAHGWTMGLRIAGAAAVCLLMLSALTFASWTGWQLVIQVSLAIAVAVVTAVLLLFVPAVRASSLALRVPAIIGAHVALLLAGLLSWSDSSLTVPAGIAIVAGLIAVAATIKTANHPIHVGVGYAYALVLVARALDLSDAFPTIAVFSLTTAVGAVGAIAATLIRRLRAPAWYAVLIVTAVPFLIGVGIVVVDRSGWAALSSGLIFLLALTLLLTRRPGLNLAVRAVAAGLLVPTLAVVVTNLAAELLKQSGSPVALPIIAVIVAGVLPSTGLISGALLRHGLPEREAATARVWIEGSALLTGVIAVILALVLPAAGLSTAFVVLVVLGLGAAATAIWAKRRYGWWVAFASFTGALWCIWALQGVTLVEPYLLPPAIALAIIGVIVTGRGGRGVALYATGLAVATMPVVGILAVVGSGDNAPVPWRTVGLLAGAWVLLLLGSVIGRGSREWMKRLAVLRVPTLAVAIAAASAGAIQGLRFGAGRDDLVADGFTQLLICLAFGAAGALAAAAAARTIIDTAAEGSRLALSRWLYAPALAYVVLSTWSSGPALYAKDWATIWGFFTLTVLVLAFMLVVVLRARRRPTTLPPVWFVFALAFVTAIVGWAGRDLRVEWFSVPLGVFLIGAGLLAMRGVSESALPANASANSWPIGHRGSWALLGPGIAVLLLASIISTGTDPQTWRAIAVIAAALLAILVGSQFKLAAPFVLGIIVLPVENVLVFAVQIGRNIESVPWWITLAIVGAVLLIIAVTYERRSGADNSVTARVRDLK